MNWRVSGVQAVVKKQSILFVAGAGDGDGDGDGAARPAALRRVSCVALGGIIGGSRPPMNSWVAQLSLFRRPTAANNSGEVEVMVACMCRLWEKDGGGVRRKGKEEVGGGI